MVLGCDQSAGMVVNTELLTYVPAGVTTVIFPLGLGPIKSRPGTNTSILVEVFAMTVVPLSPNFTSVVPLRFFPTSLTNVPSVPLRGKEVRIGFCGITVRGFEAVRVLAPEGVCAAGGVFGIDWQIALAFVTKSRT